MTKKARILLPALLTLFMKDRLSVATCLLDSVEDEALTAEEHQAEWEAELMRRIKETEMGMNVEIPAEEVRRMARESLK